MLRDVNDLYGISVAATDGLIGAVRDCYFDDQDWTIRFFVVETGSWLDGRKVLIPPIALHSLDWASKAISASMTRNQVKRSPEVDTTKPVSRQHEVEQSGYYGFPLYRGELELWGNGPRPGISLAGYQEVALPHLPRDTESVVDAQVKLRRDRGDDPHLRSAKAIQRYHIHAIDGDIGHLDSLLADDERWDIRYLVVNTSDWWLGHQVLVAPPSIIDINWIEAAVSVGLMRQSVKDAPGYDADVLANRD